MDDWDVGLGGRVAVVTGAASGIGAAIAERLAEDGADVAVVDLDLERAEQVVAGIVSRGGRAVAERVDVADGEAVQRLGDRTLDRWGRVDILCNNAGTVSFGQTWELDDAEWDRVLGVNLRSVVNGVRTFTPLLRASGDDGFIINTASMAGFVVVGTMAPYVATKRAVIGLSEVLAVDLAAAGSSITVSVLCPGIVATRLGQPDAVVPPEAELPDGVLSARAVAAAVRDAMRRRLSYVLTHAESSEEVRQFAARVLDGVGPVGYSGP